jgi:outer membrane protein, heavy metal efflux system
MSLYLSIAVAGSVSIGVMVASAQVSPPGVTVPPTGAQQYVAAEGLSAEQLIESAGRRRADLLAARQRLAIAQGRLVQAGLRPNPVFEAEYGSPRFLGGEPEFDFSAGVSQTFELGGKRAKRMAVAELEVQQVRAEISALERQVAVDIRKSYTRALAAARQLDLLEKLIAFDAELVRVTEARLNEGDVAPLDLNLVKVENDRLRVQLIDARSRLETALLEIRSLIGVDLTEPLRLAPQSDRPPRLEIGLSDLMAAALRDRADLQAARIGERIGSARITLARSRKVPDVSASARFSRTKGIIDLPETSGGGFATDRDNELTFGISIDLPFFNRNQGEIASATGEQLQAVRNREFLEATIRREVSVAYAQYRAAAEKLVVYTTQILPRSEANLQTVRAAYNAGEFSVFEVVAEQRRLNESVTAYNTIIEEYYTAISSIEAAIGAPFSPSAFTPGSTSVVPDAGLVPRQFNRNAFFRSIKGDQISRLNSLKESGATPKEEEEKK